MSRLQFLKFFQMETLFVTEVYEPLGAENNEVKFHMRNGFLKFFFDPQNLRASITKI